jgi:tetraacyldisaccharide 4'-kinase
VGAERIAQCRFDLGNLCTLDGSDERSLATLAGKRVLAIAAIGAPQAFFRQLEAAGADVRSAPFADHHAFDAADVSRLTRDAKGVELVVCTLKDAVKLAPLWTPAGMPLWYVSQHVVLEQGHSLLEHGLEAVLAERHAASSTAGGAGNA